MMCRPLRLLSMATAVVAGVAFVAPASANMALYMVEQPGCTYCAEWNAVLAPIYPKTPEGRAAPLIRVQLSDPFPPEVELTSRPVFTPTFILVQDNIELGRIEGYPGEDFFWGLLAHMIDSAETPSKSEGGLLQ